MLKLIAILLLSSLLVEETLSVQISDRRMMKVFTDGDSSTSSSTILSYDPEEDRNDQMSVQLKQKDQQSSGSKFVKSERY